MADEIVRATDQRPAERRDATGVSVLEARHVSTLDILRRVVDDLRSGGAEQRELERIASELEKIVADLSAPV